MRFKVDYMPIGWDYYLSNYTYTISLPEFLNSVVKSIRWNVSSTNLQLRSTGFYLYYFDYFPSNFDNSNGFVDPKIDPTEKAHFSNVVGRAFADYLAKRLLNVSYSENYEHVTGDTGSLSRPDLISTSHNRDTFAIEAKGYTQKIGTGSILVEEAKNQAGNGTYSTTYEVASITSYIYDSLKVIFKDPNGDEKKLSKDELAESAVKYYKLIFKSLRRNSVLIEDLTEINSLLKGRKIEELFADGGLDFSDYYTYIPTSLYIRQNKVLNTVAPFIVIFDKKIEDVIENEKLDDFEYFNNNLQQLSAKDKAQVIKKIDKEDQPIDLMELFGVNNKVDLFNKVNKNEAFIDTDGIGIILI